MPVNSDLKYGIRRETYERMMAEKARDDISRTMHIALADRHAENVKSIRAEKS